MAYCRWSTDDFQCDLYVYEDCAGGWTIHIAGRRTVYSEKLPPPIELTQETALEYFHRHQKIMQMHGSAKMVEIDLPYVGETILVDSLQELLATLIQLKEIGYIFPDSVIKEVEGEIAEL